MYRLQNTSCDVGYFSPENALARPGDAENLATDRAQVEPAALKVRQAQSLIKAKIEFVTVKYDEARAKEQTMPKSATLTTTRERYSRHRHRRHKKVGNDLQYNN